MMLTENELENMTAAELLEYLDNMDEPLQYFCDD